MGIGNAAIVWLLLVAIWSGIADAVRPRDARERADPYLVSPPGRVPDDNIRRPAKDLGVRNFTLRHIYHHGTHDYPYLHRYLDVRRGAQLLIRDEDGASKELAPERLQVRASTQHVQRLADRRKSAIDTLFDYAAIHGEAMSLPSSAWTIDEIPGPNFTDKSTVVTFAKMAANAYVEEPWTGKWEDVKGGFNYTDDFGWEADGLRGHIFADETNQTVVVGLKGTSMAVFDGAETTGNDKLNDNLFGSCCCGQGGQYLWKQVCDCMTSTYTCNNTCLIKSLREKSHYYFAARDLYHNVTERYPNAEVWMSGHSLGGVVSTLLGLTYGLPVMTYEAFPDALAASRLGLPTPPGYRIGAHQSRTDLAIHHFGHTADPVFMGTCDTASSLCTLAGYAFQSQCHTGMRCAYDTVGDLGWRVSVGTHRINSVIPDVLEAYDEVAKCEQDAECQDCFNWKFFESNGTETTSKHDNCEYDVRVHELKLELDDLRNARLVWVQGLNNYDVHDLFILRAVLSHAGADDHHTLLAPNIILPTGYLEQHLRDTWLVRLQRRSCTLDLVHPVNRISDCTHIHDLHFQGMVWTHLRGSFSGYVLHNT